LIEWNKYKVKVNETRLKLFCRQTTGFIEIVICETSTFNTINVQKNGVNIYVKWWSWRWRSLSRIAGLYIIFRFGPRGRHTVFDGCVGAPSSNYYGSVSQPKESVGENSLDVTLRTSGGVELRG